MIGFKFSNFIFVSTLCFCSFLLGWISALYVDRSQREALPIEQTRELPIEQIGLGGSHQSNQLLYPLNDLKDGFKGNFKDKLKNDQITEPINRDSETPVLMNTKSPLNQEAKTKLQKGESEFQTVGGSYRAEVQAGGSEGKTPFFEEMKNNILALFDPYQMDFLVRKQTHLGDKNSPYRKRPVIQRSQSNPKDRAASKKGEASRAYLGQSPQRKSSTSRAEATGKATGVAAKKPSELKNPPPSNSSSDPLSDPLSETPSIDSIFPLKTRRELRELKRLKKIQAEYDQKNRDQLMAIVGQQKFFSLDGKFSFLINGFSEREKVLEYVREIKARHPLWSVLIKARKDHFRVYIGPFPSKEKAEEFKNMLQGSDLSPDFSLDFLQEVSL